MRNTQGQVNRYSASPVPDSSDALSAFLRTELNKIQDVLNVVADGQLDVSTVAPAKPRDGMIRRANGTNWNPGSGAGVYCFYAASWHFLG